MSFEQLPDELLLMICSYLTPFEILKCFNDLNYRLNCTIRQYRRNLDFRSLNLRQFYSFCKLIRYSLGDDVRSLILSNGVPSVRQLVLFRKQIEPFEYYLPNLEHLTIIDHSDDELDLFLPLICHFKHLKELKINFVKNDKETTMCSFLSQILSNNFLYFDHFPKRKKRDERISIEKLSFIGTGFLKLTPIYNDTIRHLTIEIENLEDFIELLTGFDRLEYLNVNIKELNISTTNFSEMFYDERKAQCLSLLDFRCQSQWQKDKYLFEQFLSLMKLMPNICYSSLIFKCENSREELFRSSLVHHDYWQKFSSNFLQLRHFDCLIKCPLKSSNPFETDLLKIVANRSRTNESLVDIHLFHHDQIEKNEFSSTFELDVQELQKINGLDLGKKLSQCHELTLYSDLIVEEEKIFSTCSENLLLPDRKFLRLRSLDLLGEFPNMNNPFLVRFVEQLLRRSPHLRSIGFFLYWVENMTDLVLTFLRPLKHFLKQIEKCYLYTEGDIDRKFICELASLLPSLTLLSVKIDWYCNTADVINLCLVHLKDLIHLEIVLEEIPDYLDEDYLDRIKMEKEIESLAMTRDTREWLKRNTLLGRKSTNKLFRAEKSGNDLKIWL